MGQYRPYHAYHLVGERDYRHIHRSPLSHLLDPGAWLLRLHHHAARAVTQQRIQIRVAPFIDPVQVHLAARARTRGRAGDGKSEDMAEEKGLA